MFRFIKCQYNLGRLTTAQVMEFAPIWITEEEAMQIVGRGIVE